MRSFIVASDRYAPLLGLYAELFNKNWPGQEAVVICYDEDRVPALPENFSTISAGQQEDFGSTWTDGLIPVFRDLPDQVFAVLLEDLLLVHPVDLDVVGYMISEVRSGRASEAMMYDHSHVPGTRVRHGVAEIAQDADHRVSLHPAIWRREYFFKFLHWGYGPWMFEERGSIEARNDGHRILRSDGLHAFNCVNVFVGGEPVFEYPTQPTLVCPPIPVEDEMEIVRVVADIELEDS